MRPICHDLQATGVAVAVLISGAAVNTGSPMVWIIAQLMLTGLSQQAMAHNPLGSVRPVLLDPVYIIRQTFRYIAIRRLDQVSLGYTAHAPWARQKDAEQEVRRQMQVVLTAKNAQ